MLKCTEGHGVPSCSTKLEYEYRAHAFVGMFELSEGLPFTLRHVAFRKPSLALA